MFCTECGQKHTDGAKFCAACGTPRISVFAASTDDGKIPVGSKNHPGLLASALGGNEDAIFELGLHCIADGDLEGAQYWLLQGHEQGDTSATFELGRLHTSRNDKEAEKWFLLAEPDYLLPSCREELGDLCVRTGRLEEAKDWYLKTIEMANSLGPDEATEAEQAKFRLKLADVFIDLDDKSQGEHWYLEAVEWGSMWAAIRLGLLYEGLGESESAEKWLLHGARSGDPAAQYFLGWFYDDASIITEAEKWYLASSEAGEEDAMFRLGLLYRRQNQIDDAKKWLERSATNGNEEAQAELDGLNKHLAILDSPPHVMPTGNWWEKIDDLVNNRLTFDQFVDTLILFMLHTTVVENPEGQGAALSRRMVWHFEDDTVIWMGYQGTIYLSHLTIEHSADSMPIIPNTADHGHFDFASETNGWVYTGPLSIVDLINAFAVPYGTPTLVLPWGDAADYVQSIDDGLWGIYNELDDEDETQVMFDAIASLFTAIVDGNLEIPGDIWDFKEEIGSQLIPRYSQAGRFTRFLDALEATGWLLLLDECCDTCAYSSFKQQREHENQSAFITWLQGAENYWKISGAVDHHHWATREEASFLQEFAATYGLTATELGVENGQVHLVFN